MDEKSSKNSEKPINWQELKELAILLYDYSEKFFAIASASEQDVEKRHMEFVNKHGKVISDLYQHLKQAAVIPPVVEEEVRPSVIPVLDQPSTRKIENEYSSKQRLPPSPSEIKSTAMPSNVPPAKEILPDQSAILPAANSSAGPSAVVPRLMTPVMLFQLRNARQSQPFDEKFIVSPVEPEVHLVAVDIPANLGLRWEPGTLRVQGVPMVSGEHPIDLKYHVSKDKSDPIQRARVTLFVNPDPKLLWENKPSDRTLPHWKVDELCETRQVTSKYIVAARKRGRSHAHVGSCCDDDFFIETLVHDDDEQHIAIVADGAGSASEARLGSKLAVEAAGAELKALLTGAEDRTRNIQQAVQTQSAEQLTNVLRFLLGRAAHAAMVALNNEARKRPEPAKALKALSTTLLIGLSCKVGAQWLCAAYWIGDGAAGVLLPDGKVKLLGEPDSGEYSGQTRFLDSSAVTPDELHGRIRHCLVEDYKAFILMTDGVSDPKFETEALLAHGEAWQALWAELEDQVQLAQRDADVAKRLLAWLDFWSPGNHDDRTIALIY